MSNDKLKEEKKFNPKGQDSKRKSVVHKIFKSMFNGFKKAVFESRAVKHAAQFIKELKEIAKYGQKKYNHDIAKMIEDVERPKFDFPARWTTKIIVNSDGTTIQEKIDEMDIYIWKKDYELILSQKTNLPRKRSK